jgi:hypothetical protein
MNPILRFFIVALLALSVASCGIPPLLNRTVNNTVRQVGSLGSAQ